MLFNASFFDQYSSVNLHTGQIRYVVDNLMWTT